MQNARVTAFTVSELLRENEQVEGGGRGGGGLPPTQIRVNVFTNPLDMGYKLYTDFNDQEPCTLYFLYSFVKLSLNFNVKICRGWICFK